MTEFDKERMNHLAIWLIWASCIGAFAYMCIRNTLSIICLLILFFVPGYRYLAFPIYPLSKAEYIKQAVDQQMPFTTSLSMFLRKSSVPGGTLVLRLGAFVTLIGLVAYNGYRCLWLDTRMYNYGKTVIPHTDAFDRWGAAYQLLPNQIDRLRQLARSDDPDDQRLLKQKISDIENFALAKRLHPLGLLITQKYATRSEITDVERATQDQKHLH